ncbi:MAG: aconitate hydratase AcnA [Propionibacteriaceae bacterium]|jgi:aconitate hydratase|nr:aconitate hydratase AcnA [Propionibacteriaceae bacterium]
MSTQAAVAQLTVGSNVYDFYPIDQAQPRPDLPYSLRVLLENLLRAWDGQTVTDQQLAHVAGWEAAAEPGQEIQFTPGRVVMQDFTGVPCVVDLATMREAVQDLGGRPGQVNPLAPAELVIDHSVIADVFGRADALARNVDREYQRNGERYRFLRWGQTAFDDFAVVPPGTGIVHQVNIEHLARVVASQTVDGRTVAYPDTCVGTDSHTTMVNGLGVVGWGVGGIEAEAALLGQPVPMLIPRVVGFKLSGQLGQGVTATDLVLTIAEMLRQHKVVGKFVEFYGPGVAEVPVANRCTIGNMSPEYGSTIAVFPIDAQTTDYLRLTGRPPERIALVEAYAKAQGLWHDPGREPVYSECLSLDLADVEPSIAGPKRPQDRIQLKAAKQAFAAALPAYAADPAASVSVDLPGAGPISLRHGTVAVAAITSCTNTSNPQVMVAAGLVAKKAVALGLRSRPWVKTTLSPGSKVVTDYFDAAGLTPVLDELGFNVVGYGCVTCIGNTGPIVPAVAAAVNERDLTVTAVLSGNRNFEGRISPDVKMNYLASPPLVIAYALAGTMDIDFATEPVGCSPDGKEVFLKDIWPSQAEVDAVIQAAISPTMYAERYADVFTGDERWQGLDSPSGQVFTWDPDSTYIRKAPYFDGLPRQPQPLADIAGARVLLKLGDSVTTDHISPAGSIKPDSPAGRYLAEHGVARADFNSYGSRRGNHEVMVRGTFANIRLRNQLAPGTEGGVTRDFTLPGGPVTSVYEASLHYLAQGVPLVVLAGKEYGSGSSRDWAAKGTKLLGVTAVLAESYERIHRSNLLGMGVLPLQFPAGQSADSLGLTGTEAIAVSGIAELNQGSIPPTVRVTAADGARRVEFDAVVRIDTPKEAEYLRHGGILPYVLRELAAAA